MATRFYFPASTASDVNPSFHSDWSYQSEALRRKLASTKGSSAIAAGSQIGPFTSQNPALDRQYVSDRLAAGIVFTAASTTIKGQLMVREYNAGDDVTRIFVGVRVVSQDGNTVKATLSSVLDHGTGLEFINNATHRNMSMGSPATFTVENSYTTDVGDRLVIEIGYGYVTATGATPEASAKWGENATELPENNSQTTDGAGWIEFSNTITMQVDAVPKRSYEIKQAVNRSNTY